MPVVNYCGKCKKQIPTGVGKCPHCGVLLHGERAARPDDFKPPEATPSKEGCLRCGAKVLDMFTCTQCGLTKWGPILTLTLSGAVLLTAGVMAYLYIDEGPGWRRVVTYGPLALGGLLCAGSFGALFRAIKYLGKSREYGRKQRDRHF